MLVSHVGSIPEKVILKYYEDDNNICDYELELNEFLSFQDIQKYKIPKLGTGQINVCVECDNSVIDAGFYDARKLRNQGLLIYFSDGDDDIHTYFISGKNKKCFKQKWFPQKQSNWEECDDYSYLYEFMKEVMGHISNDWQEKNRIVKIEH